MIFLPRRSKERYFLFDGTQAPAPKAKREAKSAAIIAAISSGRWWFVGAGVKAVGSKKPCMEDVSGI